MAKFDWSDIVNELSDLLYDAQDNARKLQYHCGFKDGSRAEYLAEELQHHLRFAVQTLADISDEFEADDDAE